MSNAELAERYGTTPRVIASWLDDVRSGRGLIASAYAPTDSELLDATRRGIDELVARVRELAKHETLEKCCRAVDTLLRVHEAIASLALPEPAAYAEPDLDRELADFLRVTESPLSVDALRN